MYFNYMEKIPRVLNWDPYVPKYHDIRTINYNLLF